MINVVVLNGGRGASSLIPELLNIDGLNVTSIVNAYDDGKSTGEIRRFFDMLGPSDLRKVQELMLPVDSDYSENLKLFNYRFPEKVDREYCINEIELFIYGKKENLLDINIKNSKVKKFLKIFLSEFLDSLNIEEKIKNVHFNFSDCSIMNCIYAGAFIYSKRDLSKATKLIDKLFRLKGSVLPNNIENKVLVAQRENGDILYTEADIVELRSNVTIDRVYLLDNYVKKDNFEPLSNKEKKFFLEKHNSFARVSEDVKMSLKLADIIIYSAGTQHSSLYPTYMSYGLSRFISENNSAFKVFITNIGADYETPKYKASDFIHGAYRYLNMSDSNSYKMQDFFDLILINNSRINAGETYVECDKGLHKIDIPMIIDGFESKVDLGKHDGEYVVKTIIDNYNNF